MYCQSFHLNVLTLIEEIVQNDLFLTSVFLYFKVSRLELQLPAGCYRVINLQYSNRCLVSDFTGAIELGLAANRIEEVLKVILVNTLVTHAYRYIITWRFRRFTHIKHCVASGLFFFLFDRFFNDAHLNMLLRPADSEISSEPSSPIKFS